MDEMKHEFLELLDLGTERSWLYGESPSAALVLKMTARAWEEDRGLKEILTLVEARRCVVHVK